MRRLKIFLSAVILVASYKAMAWPKTSDEQIVELEKRAQHAAESLLTTYGLDEAERKLIEIMMMSFSIAREAREAKSPALRQATELRLHVINGGSEDLSTAQLKSVKRPLPDQKIIYPEFLNRVLLFVENEVNYRLPYQGFSSKEVLAIKEAMISLSGEFAHYATTGSFQSEKFVKLFEIASRNPVTTYNEIKETLKALINEQWQLRKEGKLADAQAKLAHIKALYIQAEALFKIPFFHQQKGAETLYEFKDRPGFAKRFNQPGKTQNDVTITDVDLNKPMILDHIISEVSQFLRFGNVAELGQEYFLATKLLYAELQARRSSGGSYTKVLTDLRQGSFQGVERSLKFFEDRDNQILLGVLKQSKAQGLSHYIFPLLLKAAGSTRLAQLKKRTTDLLNGWKDSGFIDPSWVTDRLEELASSGKPRLGYNSVDAEAKDLFDFAYLGTKYDQEKEKVLFDTIYEIAKRHPELVKTYLANREPGRKYFVRLIEERGGIHLLSEEAKSQLLSEFFPNPKDRTVADRNIDIRSLESVLKSGVMDLGTLVDLFFAVPENSHQKKEIEEITNKEINKIQDPIIQRRIKAMILRQMIKGNSEILGSSILDILKTSLTPNYCSRLFRIRS